MIPHIQTAYLLIFRFLITIELMNNISQYIEIQCVRIYEQNIIITNCRNNRIHGNVNIFLTNRSVKNTLCHQEHHFKMKKFDKIEKQ